MHPTTSVSSEHTSLLILEFDARRGGFCLSFGDFARTHSVRIIGGLLEVLLDGEGRILALESYWDHGGLPLSTLHNNHLVRAQCHLLSGPDFRTPELHLLQNPERITLWFASDGELPRAHWSVQRDKGYDVALWFTGATAQAGWPVPGRAHKAESPVVAGIELGLARATARFPFSELRLIPTDFKG